MRFAEIKVRARFRHAHRIWTKIEPVEFRPDENGPAILMNAVRHGTWMGFRETIFAHLEAMALVELIK